MTRLTFTRSQDGLRYVTKDFMAREKLIRGTILCNNAEFAYSISNIETTEIIHIGNCDNFHKAKHLLKVKFKELGVLFNNEVRKKVE